MSLQFPASPTNGQTFQGWIWNGQAWAPNVAAQFVTSINGKTGPLTFADVDAPGTRVLLNTQVISAPVANVDFVSGLSGSFDDYEVTITGLTLSVASLLALRMSVDGGATYLAGAADYAYTGLTMYVSTTSNAYWGATFNSIALCLTHAAVTNVSANFYLRFPNLRNTAFLNKPVIGETQHSDASIGGARNHLLGYLAINPPTNQVGGLRFFPLQGGNLNTGTFRLYGVRK